MSGERTGIVRMYAIGHAIQSSGAIVVGTISISVASSSTPVLVVVAVVMAAALTFFVVVALVEG
jgi:hypothetical protein